MKQADFEKLMDSLDQIQQEAVEKREEHEGPNGEPTSKGMYWLGKDVGVAHAKQVVRQRIEVEDE